LQSSAIAVVNTPVLFVQTRQRDNALIWLYERPLGRGKCGRPIDRANAAQRRPLIAAIRGRLSPHGRGAKHAGAVTTEAG
jgi:hypothetical protein